MTDEKCEAWDKVASKLEGICERWERLADGYRSLVFTEHARAEAAEQKLSEAVLLLMAEEGGLTHRSTRKTFLASLNPASTAPPSPP